MKRPESEEIAPSLRLRELPKEIEGLEPGKDFEAHIKGKCISHDHQKGHSSEYPTMETSGKDENKDHHHYELEVHHFDHKGEGGMPKKKKTGREEVEDAMDKHDKMREDEKKKKEPLPE